MKWWQYPLYPLLWIYTFPERWVDADTGIMYADPALIPLWAWLRGARTWQQYKDMLP